MLQNRLESALSRSCLIEINTVHKILYEINVWHFVYIIIVSLNHVLICHVCKVVVNHIPASYFTSVKMQQTNTDIWKFLRHRMIRCLHCVHRRLMWSICRVGRSKHWMCLLDTVAFEPVWNTRQPACTVLCNNKSNNNIVITVPCYKCSQSAMKVNSSIVQGNTTKELWKRNIEGLAIARNCNVIHSTPS